MTYLLHFSLLLLCLIKLQLYSLHTEVYRLRVAESGAHHNSASSSSPTLRRMHNENVPYLRATAAADSSSHSRSGPNGWADGRSGDYRFDPNAPLPPPPPLPGNHQQELQMRHTAAQESIGQLPLRSEDDGRGRAGEWAQAEATRMTDTEKKLHELLATRDLLRSTGRRKAPDPGPLPDYMQL